MKTHASMNRAYRLVWNATTGLWVAVAEHAKGRSKGGAALVLLSALTLGTPQAHAANAADASVSSGTGTVATQGNTTTINQVSQRLAIDWTQLSTRANEALVFNQPNASAIALNRITGSSPSEFLGSLTANGQVFILNPNGVLFGAGAQVNVGGLVASTLSMSNADFQADNLVFSNSGTGATRGTVVNQGTLAAAPGGYLALLAPEVRNEGVMTAHLGTALLAAGNKVTLTLNNGSLLGYSIDQGALNALAQNSQLIQANGGQVVLSAKALDSLSAAAVNNTGIIEAKTLQNQGGRILLLGDMATGTVTVGGTLDASAPNGGDGGFIETSAAHVKLQSDLQLSTAAASGKTGKYLIDPTDFTIAASGGDMSGAQLAALLGRSDVEIQSTRGSTSGNGDINVNDNVGWSANQLTLTAVRDINVNAVMSATGSASLALNTGSNGNLNMKMKADGTGFVGRVDLDTSGTLHINGEQYTIIRTLGDINSTTGTDLQGMQVDPNGRYVLGADIDATATTDTYNWGEDTMQLGFYNRIGMRPLSTAANPFTGKFDGLGHTISNAMVGPDLLPNSLTIDANNPLGLFGAVATSGTISNLMLSNAQVNGFNFGYDTPPGGVPSGASSMYNGAMGMLAGTNAGTVRNVTVTGSEILLGNLTSTGPVGVVVGTNTGTLQGVIGGSYGSTLVLWSGQASFFGGVAGINRGLIANSSFVGNMGFGGVVGTGGLAGLNDTAGVIRDSTVSGQLADTAAWYAGGAAGVNRGLIERVGSAADVFNVSSGYSYTVGGLVGLNASNGTIRDSWASGNVRTRPLTDSSIPYSFSLWSTDTGTWQSYSYSSFVPAVGGLVGEMDSGTITGSHSTAGVSSIPPSPLTYTRIYPGVHVGGLVGWGKAVDGNIVIQDSWASGTVSSYKSSQYVGGFIGTVSAFNPAYTALIERSYATGNVSVNGAGFIDQGNSYAGLAGAGGFAGVVEGVVTIRQAYSTGNVDGIDSVISGFIGVAYPSGTGSQFFTTRPLLEDVYETGNVTSVLSGAPYSSDGAAGFGYRLFVIIRNAYQTGTVSTMTSSNGYAFGTTPQSILSNTFYNSTANSNLLAGGAVGKTEAELKQASTFNGFDIATTGGSGAVWRIYEGQSTPLLTALLKPLTVTADDVTKVYDGTSAGLSNVGYSDPAAAGSGQVLGLNQPYGNVPENAIGSYSPYLYSTQQGYDITIAGGHLTVIQGSATAAALGQPALVPAYDSAQQQLSQPEPQGKTDAPKPPPPRGPNGATPGNDPRDPLYSSLAQALTCGVSMPKGLDTLDCQ